MCPCPQSWSFKEYLTSNLVGRSMCVCEYFSFSVWIFFSSYFCFSWPLTLCKEVAMRKTKPTSAAWMCPEHLGHCKGPMLCKALDELTALQVSWLQWKEGTFYHLLSPHSSLPYSSLKVSSYLNMAFSTAWDRTVTQGEILTHVASIVGFWEMWPWLPAKAISLLLSSEVSTLGLLVPKVCYWPQGLFSQVYWYADGRQAWDRYLWVHYQGKQTKASFQFDLRKHGKVLTANETLSGE